ncbi:MAG: sulfatase [Clostridia bacterium]
MENFFHSEKRPNVIWVVVDQMRAQAMGFMGDCNVRTPNLDNMAREGVVFRNAVSGTPWCCPFRGSLLTGLYAHKNGVTQTPKALDPTIPTITKPFKDSGYHTAWVGKWHLDGSNYVTHYIPKERRGGFDYFMGYENNNNQNECYVFGNDCEKPQRLKGYETDELTKMFLNHIENHVTEKEDYDPFFAVLSVQPPHDPYVTPYDTDGSFKYYKNPENIKLRHNVPPGVWSQTAKNDLAGYYGMIENIDTNMGIIRNKLAQLNIDRETYVVFMSDHGDCLYSHGQQHKSSPWEESIRIPFIVSRVGGNCHMNLKNTNAMLNHIDIAPTTLGLCGIEVPNDMVGYDFSSQCVSKSNECYKENSKPEPTAAYLQQIPRKYHKHVINKQWRGVVTQDGYKYVCCPNHEVFMFNLNDDPFEMSNLCFDTFYNDKKEELHKLLKDFITDTEDSFELPDISLQR